MKQQLKNKTSSESRNKIGGKDTKKEEEKFRVKKEICINNRKAGKSVSVEIKSRTEERSLKDTFTICKKSNT